MNLLLRAHWLTSANNLCVSKFRRQQATQQSGNTYKLALPINLMIGEAITRYVKTARSDLIKTKSTTPNGMEWGWVRWAVNCISLVTA